MRIIHFSDPHAGGWIRDRRGYCDKRLLGALNFLLRRRRSQRWFLVEKAVKKIKSLSPDIVICTGDVSSISEQQEFDQAKAALRPLVEDENFMFLFIPGNHDAYVKSCKGYLENAFSFFHGGNKMLTELPYLIDIHNIRLAMFNESHPVAPWLSSGYIDKPTQDWLTRWIIQRKDFKGKKIILVHHFPLFDDQGKSLSFRRRCNNNEFLQEAFRKGNSTISLCGHIHQNFVRREKNGSTEYCAGSLTLNGTINVIDYDSQKDTISQKWLYIED